MALVSPSCSAAFRASTQARTVSSRLSGFAGSPVADSLGDAVAEALGDGSAGGANRGSGSPPHPAAPSATTAGTAAATALMSIRRPTCVLRDLPRGSPRRWGLTAGQVSPTRRLPPRPTERSVDNRRDHARARPLCPA